MSAMAGGTGLKSPTGRLTVAAPLPRPTIPYQHQVGLAMLWSSACSCAAA